MTVVKSMEGRQYRIHLSYSYGELIPCSLRLARASFSFPATTFAGSDSTLDGSLLAARLSRYSGDGRGSGDAGNRHELPRQIVTVARVKYFPCHPRRSPLAKGVAHDDERQKLSE
jgi:hypothetical protein